MKDDQTWGYVDKIPLRCQRGDCNLPWAYIHKIGTDKDRSVLVIESRHWGKKHTNYLSIRQLKEIIAKIDAEESRLKTQNAPELLLDNV